jgi:hypothetical protein
MTDVRRAGATTHEPVDSPDDEATSRRLHRFSSWVSLALILLCNGVLALGVWGSGVNLDRIIRLPEVFNPLSDVCLRFGWHNVAGAKDPVRLCNEWIQLSDPSGESHTLKTETTVVQGADGRLYFDHGARMGYQAFVLAAFVGGVIAGGVAAKRWLIGRYRARLGLAGSKA